ncbi:MAG TPA: stage II sporulation protein P [Bacilli bacterium]|nr:stage II sporulation protein P [Bacilli bacterium]
MNGPRDRRDKDKQSRFRSYTFHFSSQKARTTIVTVGMAVAVFVVILSVLAVQLIAGGGQKGLAGRILHNISDNSLRGVISQEVPMYASAAPGNTLADSTAYPKGFSNMLLYLLTDVDASNPVTLLGFQVPGMAVSEYRLITQDPKYDVPPTEHGQDDTPNENPQPRPPVVAAKPSNEPLVYIYHSHNRESFLPDLPGKTDPDEAYDATKNIEQAGAVVQETLKKAGIPTLQTLEDYWTKGPFPQAYDFSRPTVQSVLKEHKDLKLIFDIHRDAGDRDVTTRTINGVDYATIYWIVGGGNPDFKKHEELAKTLNSYLEKMYPGISRGAFTRPYTAAFDTRYNQDLNPNMLIVEIGGPHNSLEEVKRTAKVLGEVAAAYLKDLQKHQPDVKAEGTNSTDSGTQSPQ